jgi:hypothetical protein
MRIEFLELARGLNLDRNKDLSSTNVSSGCSLPAIGRLPG